LSVYWVANGRGGILEDRPEISMWTIVEQGEPSQTKPDCKEGGGKNSKGCFEKTLTPAAHVHRKCKRNALSGATEQGPDKAWKNRATIGREDGKSTRVTGL